jgi:hypothetical protein
MKPILTFTPQMFAVAVSRRKDITRRVALTGNQDQLDLLASAIEKDLACKDGLMTKELAVWNTFPAPYGPPGTILPMATTWAAAELYDSKKPSEIENAQSLWFDDGTAKPSWTGKNRPARFLPKSLYHLAPQVQIVSNRAEPLHAITEEDAIREGAPPHGQHAQAHRAGFERLWDSINVTRNDGLYAWDKNTIVWRIEFKLL